MKEFQNMVITGDTLTVLCADTENKEETATFAVDLKQFYVAPKLDLEHNVYYPASSSCFDEEEFSADDVREDASINDEFMKYFCNGVSELVVSKLEESGIAAYDYDFEEEEHGYEVDYLYIEVSFETAVRHALKLDDDWNRKVPCRFNDEDVALLRSVGIDPCGDVPDEILDLIKMGCPVLDEEPQFLKDEESQ